MSDQFQAVTVVLSEDVREEDLRSILDAIRMVKGVASVSDKHVVDSTDYMARARVRFELGSTMLDVFRAITEGRSITIGKKQ